MDPPCSPSAQCCRAQCMTSASCMRKTRVAPGAHGLAGGYPLRATPQCHRCCRSMSRGLRSLLQTLSPSSNTQHAQRPAALLQVNVQVEIKDDKTAIPRNSLIEANQSGLIAESLIDITPQQPVPQYKVGTCLGASPGRYQKQSRGSHSEDKWQHAQRCACLHFVSSQACRLLRAAH